MEKQVKSIADVIDMGIVEFITDYTWKMGYADLNNIHKLLEVEQVRLVPLREQLLRDISTVTINSEEFSNLLNTYISTFVIEKTIMDKLVIIDHVMGMKEVKAPRQTDTEIKMDKAPRQSKKQ